MNDEKDIEFQRLVEKHKSTITSVCMMFSDDMMTVDDLVQESLINIWRGFSSFEERSDVKTWLWRICLNTCLTFDRKKKNVASSTSLENLKADILEEKSEENAHVKILYQRIRQLNALDRAIVLLWLEGMPYDEIGLVIGISAKNVSVRLVRIKEQLKKMSNIVEE